VFEYFRDNLPSNTIIATLSVSPGQEQVIIVRADYDYTNVWEILSLKIDFAIFTDK